MIDSRYKHDFDRDGFVVVPQFLPVAEFQLLGEQLQRYIRDLVPTLADASAFYDDRSRPETLKQLQHMGCDAFFDDYRRHPRWTELAELLVGEPVAGQQPEWFNKPAGTDHATPPHQDNFYFCLRPPNVVTLWLALDSVDEENGCLRYVPGSHLSGIRPHGATQVLGFSQGISDYAAEDQRQERRVRLRAGDLVAHHGETIHRADANRSADRQRRAFAMVFRGVSCQRDETAYRRYTRALADQHRRKGLQSEEAAGA